MTEYNFPFGQPVRQVAQKDRSPKQLFVLGVYASAVHARWIGPDGKQKVAALAVASEPDIFWTGANASKIIGDIQIPEEAGKLVDAGEKFNGPSGKTLDELFFKPLGVARSDTWLCDLLPESRMNPNQKRAINLHYEPLRTSLDLPNATVPDFRTDEIATTNARERVLQELKMSHADTLVLLGDLPIRHFLCHYCSSSPRKLSDFSTTAGEYGKRHRMALDGMQLDVIPLCHPRQAGRLGRSSQLWAFLHAGWVRESRVQC